jgi:hypothetical protein
VEVSVALDDETIEQALERLVSETAADERTRWMEDRVADGMPQPMAAFARPQALVESMTTGAATGAPAGLAMPRRNPLATPKIADAVVRIGPREEEPSMVPVEQIIDELQHLTSRADGSEAVPAPVPARSVALPRLPPRAIDIAQAASANAAASHALAMADEQHRRSFADRQPATIVPTLPSLPTPRLPAMAPMQSNSALPSPAGRATAAPAETSIELNVTATAEGAEGRAVPSQRQVELAVAATDQLIESLQRESGVKRLSVRVVLRTSDQSAVEAEAEWEAS